MIWKTGFLLIIVMELPSGTQQEDASPDAHSGGVRREDAPPELLPHLDHLAKSLTEIFNRKLKVQEGIFKQRLQLQDERFSQVMKEKDEIIQSQQSKLDDVTMKLGIVMDNQNSMFKSTQTEPKAMSTKSNTSEPFVGFMATPTMYRTYELADRIIFDDVYFDASNNYNPNNSVFTCPFDGYYHFAVVIASAEYGDGGWLPFHVFLVVGGRYHLKAITTGSVLQITQGSISGVYRCAEGEHVYVEAAMAGERALFGSQHSAFSGHLISRVTP